MRVCDDPEASIKTLVRYKGVITAIEYKVYLAYIPIRPGGAHMLKSISVKDFRQKMSDALNRVAYGGENIAITRRDEIVAVLISYQELQELRKFRDQPTSDEAFEKIVDGVMDKNEKLYTRLAE